MPLLAELAHRRLFPQLDRARLEEIIGGERFWTQFRPRAADREYLPVGFLRQMIATEAEPEPGASAASPGIDGALSWLAASFDLARRLRLPFIVALAPVATVDPSFTEFWQPWPRYNRYNAVSDRQHDLLAAALAKSGVPFVDLKHDLAGVRDAFRKTDMHWTERGSEIVAARLAAAALAMR